MSNTSYGFVGKPMDSECFYGFHDKCIGCNCKCHPDAEERYGHLMKPAPAPVNKPSGFEAWWNSPAVGGSKLPIDYFEEAFIREAKNIAEAAWNAAKAEGR
jgi:hypothetical protein